MGNSPKLAKNKRSHKKAILFGLTSAFIAILGTVFVYYMQQMNRPEKVLTDALTNALIDITEGRASKSVGALSFTTKNETPIKIRAQFDGRTLNDGGQGSADITVDYGGKSYTFKTSVLFFDNGEVYFKAEDLAALIDQIVEHHSDFASYRSYVDPIIAKIDGRWVRISEKDLQLFGLSNDEQTKVCSQALKDFKLSSSDSRTLKKLFQQNPFVTVLKNLPQDTVTGENSFHYKLDFNDRAAEQFALKVIELESFAKLKKECKIDPEDVTDIFKQAQASNSESRVKPTVELWVGKKSRRPTKFRITTEDKAYTLDFNTTLQPSSQKSKIEKPANAIPINDLKNDLQVLIPSSISTSQM